MIEAIGHVRGGTFGDIYMARGLCFKRRDTIGRAAVEPVPVRRRLQPVDRTCAVEAVHAKPLPLQLALDLGHGQRRSRQPGRSTRSMSRAGASASAFRIACPPSAGTSCSTTTRRRRTRSAARSCSTSPAGHPQDDGVRSAALDSNNEAGLGRGLFSRHNSIGSIFYGSKGYLAAGNEDSLQLRELARHGSIAWAAWRIRQRSLRELRRLRPEPKRGRAARADRRGAHLVRARAPGECLIPPRTLAEIRSRH